MNALGQNWSQTALRQVPPALLPYQLARECGSRTKLGSLENRCESVTGICGSLKNFLGKEGEAVLKVMVTDSRNFLKTLKNRVVYTVEVCQCSMFF